MPDVNHLAGADTADLHDDVPENYVQLFQAGKTVNGFDPVEGNRGQLMADSKDAINSIVPDIDAAQEHVHLLFYIWLSDNSGLKVVEALKLAAARGVNCRVMSDDLGSRLMIASEHWKEMKSAAVHLTSALPISRCADAGGVVCKCTSRCRYHYHFPDPK